MRAWRVELLTEGGGRIGWARSALRFVLAFVSAAAAGLGFVWSLLEPSRRCWHDLGSGSRLVVRAKSSGKTPGSR